MRIIQRLIYPTLLKELRRREISILLGPRQVGKTFLLKQLEQDARRLGRRTKYFDLEIPHDLLVFNKPETAIFEMLSSNAGVVFIDEFHYLKNAGRIFKAIFDSGKKIKIFASGSSSIEMHKHLRESLAGRRLATQIDPLSLDEFLQGSLESRKTANFYEYLTYGGLPGLLHVKGPEFKMRLLQEFLATYIQKDVKALIQEENIRAFSNLLYLLAESQGSLISENSLAREVGLSAVTIHQHLSILEKTYLGLPLYSYARRLGNELKKSKKFYLYDLGIRNALLRDFGHPAGRPDRGVLHETFAYLQLRPLLKPNMEIRFWRNKQGLEIDFVVLKDRLPLLIEVKSSLKKPEIPPAFNLFMKHYPETKGGIVLSENFNSELKLMGKKILFAPLSQAASAVESLL